MSGQLQAYGYRIVEDSQSADLWLVNTCTVKNPSETAMVNIVKKGKDLDKPMVVAGCVPQGDKNVKGLEVASLLGVAQIDRVVEAVEETLQVRACLQTPLRAGGSEGSNHGPLSLLTPNPFSRQSWQPLALLSSLSSDGTESEGEMKGQPPRGHTWKLAINVSMLLDLTFFFLSSSSNSFHMISGEPGAAFGKEEASAAGPAQGAAQQAH